MKQQWPTLTPKPLLSLTLILPLGMSTGWILRMEK
jgi:hypothetical protein